MFSSAVTLSLTLLQLYLDYNRDVSIINSRLDEIGRSYLDSIGQSLWNLDEGQLRLQLKGILRLPDVRAVEVHETTGADRPTTIAVGERGSESVIAREFPIVHVIRGSEQLIGRLYVEATLTEVYRSLLDRALVILASQGAKTFLVSFFIVYIFYRLVTRHLAEIASFVAGYGFGQPRRAFALRRTAPRQPDELDQVVSAFNAMFTGLGSAYDQIRAANAQLELDIAARLRAEEALRESEQLFRDYAETASDWFWATDAEHRFTYLSEEVGVFGIDRAEVIGALRWDFAVDLGSEADMWLAHRSVLDRHESFRGFVYRSRTEDGRVRHLSISGKPIFDAEGRFLGYRGTASDVTARSAAEARVRELSLAVEQSPAGIAIVDQAGRIVYSNRMFRRITGLGETDRRVAMTSFLPQASWQRLSAAARQGEVGREEVSAQRSSQESFWALVSVAGIGASDGSFGRLVVALEDTTQEKAAQQEREELQLRLQQTGKMEAIGRLAGGIAHDFNNLLGAMMGFAQFLADDLPSGSESSKHAERILRICERGKDLVEQLLAFARARDTERGVLDLAAVLESCRDLLETSLPSSSKLVFESGAGPLPVYGNEGQLSQVLLNLCLNAKDALGGEPGTVTVELSRVRPDRDTRRKVERFGSGRLDLAREYARIAVTDTGVGMDAAIRARIFEPFFTTKELGRGTGLGLAVVHGIVTSYGGVICVESEPGAGSTFEIYLPLEDGPPVEKARRLAEQVEVRGRERILVVDDDPDLVQVLTIGLNRLGYEVLSLTDPAKALRVFSEDPELWDVVVSDQVMPGMAGLMLVGKLKALRPELRAILYTGFDEGVTERSASDHGVDTLLRKPIGPRQLAAHIRKLMDRRDGPA